MADEAQTPAAETVQADPARAATPETSNADGGGQQPEGEARAFTQAEVDAIVEQRLDRDRKAREKKAEKDKADADAKAAMEKGEFEKLYNEERAKREAIEKEANELKLASLRRDAAAKYKLPVSLSDRLKGETLEELEEDAKSLAATLPKPGAPNTNDTHGGQPNGAAMSEEELTHLSGVLGLPAKYLKQAGG